VLRVAAMSGMAVLVAIPAVLTGLTIIGGTAVRATVALAVTVVVALALPTVRAALFSPQALPLLLAAPAAVAVYPALAAPVTTGILLVVLLRRRLELDNRDWAAFLLAAAALLVPLAGGLARHADWVYVAGDALQFAAFFVAAMVGRTQDLGLLSRRSLWGLWVAVAAVTVANALGRVDFLAAAGSNVERNINFLAPILLVWALTSLLWNGVSCTALFWTGCGVLFVLLGFTRGMWAGAAAGVLGVLLVYLTGSSRGLRRVRRLAAVGVVAAAGAAVLSLAAPQVTAIAVQKVESLVDRGKDFTYQQRNLESEAVLDQQEHPLVGDGWGATFVMPALAADSWSGGNVEAGTTHYVHNQYVAHFFRTGWVGCALTLGSLFLLLRVRRGSPGTAAAVGTMIYVLVTGWTSPSLFTYPTNVLAGLALGAASVVDATWRAGGRPTPLPPPIASSRSGVASGALTPGPVEGRRAPLLGDPSAGRDAAATCRLVLRRPARPPVRRPLPINSRGATS
jgi:hypothetical protein